MDAPIAANAAENVGGVEAEAVITSRGTKFLMESTKELGERVPR